MRRSTTRLGPLTLLTVALATTLTSGTGVAQDGRQTDDAAIS